MKWSWRAVILLLALCQAQGLDYWQESDENIDYSIDDDYNVTPEPLIITSMNYISEEVFSVCLNANPTTTPDDCLILMITTSNGEKEYPVSIDSDCTSPISCTKFKGKIKDCAVEDPVTIIFQATTGQEVIALAMANIASGSFPVFPADTLKLSKGEDPISAIVPNPITHLLRIDGALNGLTEIQEYPDALLVQDSIGTVSYLLGLPEDKSPVTLFKTVIQTSVGPSFTVCDTTIAADDIHEFEVQAIDVDAAILSYSDGGQVRVIAKKSVGNGDTESYDILVDGQQSTDELCIGGIYSETDEATCKIIWDSGIMIAQVRVIGILNGYISGTILQSIKDRDIGIQAVVEGVIEGHWKILDEDDFNYRLKLTGTLPEETEIDCTAFEIGNYCYGYFTSVTEDPCTVIVTERLTVDPTYNDNEQVEPESISPIPLPALHVTALGIDWHQNLVDVNVTTCFNHKTLDEERFFSHYEMLVINNEGQWLKHRQMSSTAKGDLCFEPLTLNTQDFDASAGAMVIVIQRATDGVTVLASGKTTLF